VDLKHELLKLELATISVITDIEHNNLGMALDRLVSVVAGLEKLQNQLEK
jgi:hypothetical protein